MGAAGDPVKWTDNRDIFPLFFRATLRWAGTMHSTVLAEVRSIVIFHGTDQVYTVNLFGGDTCGGVSIRKA